MTPATIAEIEALLVNEEDHGDLVELLLTAAPALLEAARQNERRGELLRLALDQLGYINEYGVCDKLRQDIAKELT